MVFFNFISNNEFILVFIVKTLLQLLGRLMKLAEFYILLFYFLKYRIII